MNSSQKQIHCLRVDELTADDHRRWLELCERHRCYDSPYFHPDFTRCVAAVRPDVEIGVLENAAGVCGYFPFQRQGRTGRPVGGRLSDFQGVIVEPSELPSGGELLRGCGLDQYEFDHWLGSQASTVEPAVERSESLSIDLTSGWTGYAAALKERGSDQIAKAAQKERASARQWGPARFEPRVEDPATLELLFHWKSRQYRSSGLTDVFAFGWTRELVRTIHSRGDRAFRGLLSALYFGDRIAAVHFGMQAGSVLHAWFPAYDPELAKFSPGGSLWLQLSRHAEQLGITRIDLGIGSAWKRRFSTGEQSVLAGSCDLRPIRGACRRWWRATKSWVKDSPLRWPARIPGAVAYRVREWREFR